MKGMGPGRWEPSSSTFADVLDFSGSSRHFQKDWRAGELSVGFMWALWHTGGGCEAQRCLQ